MTNNYVKVDVFYSKPCLPSSFLKERLHLQGVGTEGWGGGGGEKLYLVHQNLISFTRQSISLALHPGSFPHFNVSIKSLARTWHKGFLYNIIGNQSWNIYLPGIPLLTLASSSASGVTFISLMKFHNVSIPNLQSKAILL